MIDGPERGSIIQQTVSNLNLGFLQTGAKLGFQLTDVI